jgi:hypothetical protein
VFVVRCDGEREREECVWVDFRGLDWWRFCGVGGMAVWEGSGGWSPVWSAEVHPEDEDFGIGWICARAGVR